VETVSPRRRALLEHFVRVRPAILGYLRLLTGSHATAEDALQETFVIVVGKLDEFDDARSFEAWVRGIARHVGQRLRVKHGREAPVGDAILDLAFADAEQRDEDTGDDLLERLTRLGRCLETLREPQRRLLQLRYDDDRRLDDIARVLGRTPGAVQVALSRLRQALLECVERQVAKHA
jgi:RNA polymerase sigma-70 factor (ECF subfamily)